MWGAGDGGGWGGSDVADKNLFVSKWWPVLPGQHPGELTGVRHLSAQERCWDVEGCCRERYWVTVMGRARLHVCFMAWGVCEAIRRLPALHFLPQVPSLYHRACDTCPLPADSKTTARGWCWATTQSSHATLPLTVGVRCLGSCLNQNWKRNLKLTLRFKAEQVRDHFIFKIQKQWHW